MVENVLGEAVAKVETTQQLGNLWGYGPQSGLGYRFLSEPRNGLIHLLVDLGDNFFDASRMDTAIGDQPEHGLAGNFAANRIKAGKQHGVGAVVDENSDSGGSLKSADVTAFAANDPALDIVTAIE